MVSPSRHTVSYASLHGATQSTQCLQARSYEELYSMVVTTQSEFAHIPSPGTFRKAALDPKPTSSPGPGDYDSEPLTVRK